MSNSDYENITICLLCDGPLELVVDFGKTPLANELSDYGDFIDDDLFDLHVMQCQKCNHVQLDTIVSSERLFKDYCYVSSTSKINCDHFISYAQNVIKRFNVQWGNLTGDVVIDIGSNDGLFLKTFKEHGAIVYGIDPAKNVAKIAIQNGIPTLTEFFNFELAQKISSNEITVNNFMKNNILIDYNNNTNYISIFKPAKIITANHMFAHTKDLKTVIRGVLELLDDKGVFIFENSYLMDMLDKKIFDVQYHEHCHTHSVTPLVKLFRQFGMKIFDVERLPNQQGGSIRVFTCRNSDDRKIEDNVFKLLNEEKQIKSKIDKFVVDIDNVRINFKRIFSQYQNKKVHCYGYAAKTTTLFYYFGITKNNITCCYEDAKLKQNKYSPGLHIPIVPVEQLYENKPDILIVSAWNFAKDIIKTHQKFVKELNGTFIVPMPNCQIIDKTNIEEYLNQ
jgi:predicted TPR repeat methyltransferase